MHSRVARRLVNVFLLCRVCLYQKALCKSQFAICDGVCSLAQTVAAPDSQQKQPGRYLKGEGSFAFCLLVGNFIVGS